jgi:hypothetical protein
LLVTSGSLFWIVAVGPLKTAMRGRSPAFMGGMGGMTADMGGCSLIPGSTSAAGAAREPAGRMPTDSLVP